MQEMELLHERAETVQSQIRTEEPLVAEEWHEEACWIFLVVSYTLSVSLPS